MHVSITPALPLPRSGLTTSSVSSRISSINNINDLIVHKAETQPTTTLLAYPASEHGRSDYVEYTAKDLDILADRVAKELTRLGLRPKNQRSSQSEVVGLLGLSNVDYIISMLALSRIGFAVLFLSTRLSIEAYVSLIQKTECCNIVASTRFAHTAEQIQGNYAVNVFPLLERPMYLNLRDSGSRFTRETELVDEENCIAFVVHSSGSTGLPKPIFQKHRACLANYASGSGKRAFLTLPLFHNHGLSTFFRGIVSGKRTAIFNANLPLTNENLVEAIESANPESFHGVPYALKVLAESERGISALARCNLVLFGGSSCPDDLGDQLVDAGVYLVGHYGATEMGQLMTSFREPEDKAWNYVRPLPNVSQYLQFDPLEDGLYECVVLDGLPTKVLSNSSDPPNSFHTRDTFRPHPTMPNAWKYIGRLDDRVTLVNGEKVLPIPYEHQIRQSEFVEDALVFGIGRTIPGLLVVPSSRAKGLPKLEILDKIKPHLRIANERAEKFGQISPEMIEILDIDTDYPRTDKGTMIRAACYKQFADLIDSVYVRFETGDGDRKTLGLEELQSYLSELFKKLLGSEELDNDTDFFDMGTDSLQAITARAQIMREIDLAGHVLSQNVIFEHASVNRLAKYLDSLSSGIELNEEDEIEVMKQLIEKYSSFSTHIPTSKAPNGEVIFLTGTTGSLGAHILSQLVTMPNVLKVYCLVRADSEEAATARVNSALESRSLSLGKDSDKIICLPSDFSREDLGLSSSIFSSLQETLTTVIHSAWAVNFNLGVRTFEKQHIRGTYNLLNLCLHVPFDHPARLFFISSISAGAGTPIPGSVEETYIANPAYAQGMGYARSKYVTEHIVHAAAEQTGMHARVLRVGQIIGDSKIGLWNSTEAIPLMIQSATTLGALPALDENPSWLPVDKCAEAIIQLSGINGTPDEKHSGEDESVVYHVQNPCGFSWTSDLLPALKAAGLDFEIVPQKVWIDRLRAGEQDPVKNPTVKLIDFFASKYDNNNPGRKGLLFKTDITATKSKVILNGYDVVKSGLIGKCVDQWRKVWGDPERAQ